MEFLLVLKGIKPCLLFHKYLDENIVLFSNVVIDCLVPIMDRLDLWSYGFGISTQFGYWVFYDARSRFRLLVDKVFLDHHTLKKKYPKAYLLSATQSLMASALGYPVPFEDYPSDYWICINDKTEEDVLISKGQPDTGSDVHAMRFCCPAGGLDEWSRVLTYFERCDLAARSVGTKLELDTDVHEVMYMWIDVIQDMLVRTEGPQARSVFHHPDEDGSLEFIKERAAELVEAAAPGVQQQGESEEDSGDNV